MKLLLASAFLLAGFVGLSNPAKAACYQNDLDAWSSCIQNERRMDEIERRQQDIQRELDSQSYSY